MNRAFDRFAQGVTEWVGSSYGFVVAVMVVVVWAVAGPVLHYSTTWQLVINTGTTIVTFFLGFLILAAENRNSKALHLKLDELVKAIPEAPDKAIAAENLPSDELCALKSDIEEELSERG